MLTVVNADGRRLVVRNGFHRPRKIASGAGAVEVMAPRVNDKRVDAETGEWMRFSSATLPPWARKTPKVSEVLPLLYLHGLSTGDFVPALEQLTGSMAGLSPATISRLIATWTEDHKEFRKRDQSKSDFVDQVKACVLVIVGVRADGSKELIAVDGGYRESGESWVNLMRDCSRRGMRAPVLAVGDGSLWFRKTLREVVPETLEQRCWVRKTANVIAPRTPSNQPFSTVRLLARYVFGPGPPAAPAPTRPRSR